MSGWGSCWLLQWQMRLGRLAFLSQRSHLASMCLCVCFLPCGTSAANKNKTRPCNSNRWLVLPIQQRHEETKTDGELQSTQVVLTNKRCRECQDLAMSSHR